MYIHIYRGAGAGLFRLFGAIMVGEPAPTNIEMAGLLPSPISTPPDRKKQNTRNQRAQQPLNSIF